MVKLIENDLATHMLNLMRNKGTEPFLMRHLLREITKILLGEVFRKAERREREIETWIGKRKFEFIDTDRITFVGVLRAGLPMLESALEMFLRAEGGFIGAKRDEETLETHIQYVRLPEIEGKRVIILDPMLATGGTLIKVWEVIKEGNPADITSVHLVASPEGLERVGQICKGLTLYTVSVDEGLNSKGFIIPGLGDMGDRLYS